MDELYLRVILKPEGATPQQCDQLRGLLSAAVRLQNELVGKSAHIVRFISDVQETKTALVIEHEPAEPLALTALFDPSLPGASPAELYDATAAILDALRAGHQIRQPRPVSHGGMCPGVLLKGPGGILKVTDFDFARSLQTVFGLDAYLCLAVGPRAAGGEIPEGTSGAWEVVLPDIIDRDDRMCAFIDASKHSNQRYEGFESKSDIIAAGSVLFLMAEHRHPYFYSDPAAHRSIDTATQIVLPSPFRRADLKEPADPMLATWCQTIRRMVALDWEKRPTADEALKATGVTPVDPRGIVVRQIDQLKAQAVEHGLDDLVWWANAIETAEQLAFCEGLPPEKVNEAKAVELLGRAIGLMAGLDWESSEQPLRRLLALPDLPAAIAEKARSIEVLRQRCLSARDRLDRIEKELVELEAMPLHERARRLDELETAMEGLLGAGLLPLLGERLRPIPGGLSVRRALLGQQVEVVRAEAGEWLARASARLDARQWDDLAELLKAPPPAAEFDDVVAARVADIRRQLAEHQEQERQREARRIDLEQRLADAEQFVKNEEPAEARERLATVLAQQEFSELAELGHLLLEQIAEQEQRLAELRQARVRVDGWLAAAAGRIKSRTLTDLAEADRLIDQVKQAAGRSEAQSKQAEQLHGETARLRQEIVDAWRKQKEKVLGELKKAQAQLDKKRYRDAEAAARELVDFDDADVSGNARKIIEAISHLRVDAAGRIQKLLVEAQEWLDSGELDAAQESVLQVTSDELAQADHLAAAGALTDRIAAARRAWEAERLQARAALEQAMAALDGGDFLKARELAQRSAANGRAEANVRERAQGLLDAIVPLADAQDFIGQKDYPAAIRSLDNTLAEKASLTPAIEKAALTLRERAVQERGQTEMAYLVEHLSRRAELEEKSGLVRSLPVEQSITRAIPEWAGQSLRSFEDFMGDWVGAHAGPAEDAALRVLSPQDRFGDKYEIVRPIGRGGMGEVYLARDVMLDRLVALKLAPSVGDLKELAEHLQTEAKAIAKLDFPKHILRINSFGATEGRYYFDTDYKEAPNLADYARENGPLSHRRVVEILIPVAQALDYAHRKGIYHRDIKPTNILVGRSVEEGPWLIDFGLAKISSICHQRVRQGLCGTPGYMAPEVIRSMGQGVDDRAADIFALGCVLYELLTGNLPFQVPRGGGSTLPRSSSSVTKPLRLAGSAGKAAPNATTLAVNKPGVARMLLNTLQGRPLELDEQIPEPLRAICKKALSPDPRERFAAAGDVSGALEAFLQDLDRREGEARLAQARGRYESRRRNQAEELIDLDEARQIASTILVQGDAKLADETKRLLAEIESARREIEQKIRLAREQLAAARQYLESRKWGLAIEAAQSTLSVGYEPALQEQARPIIEEADRQRRQGRGRMIKIGGIAAVALIVIGSAGFWWMSRPPVDKKPAIDKPVTNNAVPDVTKVTPVPTPAQLTVTPATEWALSGKQGGPFEPATRTYQLANTGGTKLNWSAAAASAEKWILLSKPAGELNGSSVDTLSVSLAEEARKLSPGTYRAAVAIIDAEKKELARLLLTLTVAAMESPIPPGLLAVKTSGEWRSDFKNGQFTPAAFIGTLENTGGQPLQWTARSDQPWVAVHPQGGALEPKGGRIEVRAAITEAAQALPGGEHMANISFEQDGKSVLKQALKLTIPMPGMLAVGIAGAWRSELKDGAFVPAVFTATLENTGGSAVAWTAAADQPWVTITPASASVAAGEKATAQITIADAARKLPPGEPTAQVSFSQEGKTISTQTLKLTIPPPPGMLTVKAVDTWQSELKDGTLTPATFTAALENTGGSPLAWTAQSDQPWVTISPNGATAAAGAKVSVQLALTDAAKALAPGEHLAKVSFLQDGKAVSTTALKLTIPAPGLLVVKVNGPWQSELKDGTLTPATFTAALENTGGSPLAWTARADQPWVTISPNGATAAAGAKVSVQLALTDAAKALAPGEHLAKVSFSQDGKAVSTTALKLTIPAPGLLLVKVNGPWQGELKDGKFSPQSFTASLQNNGGSRLAWSAASTQPWLTIAPASGVLAKPGDQINVVVSVTDQANTLAAGDYAAAVAFSQDGKLVSTQNISLRIPASMPAGDTVWTAERAAIERDLPAASGDMDAKRAYDLLVRLARVKYMQEKPSITQEPDLARWTVRLQNGLANRESDGLKIKPYRFIEYFMGPQDLHALCWYADASGLQGVRYYRLTTGGGAASSLAQIKSGGQGLGDVIIRPILADSLTVGGNKVAFFPGGTLDSFGVAIGPDGPLAFVSVDRLTFAPLGFAGLTLPDETLSGRRQRVLTQPISRLVDLCQVPGGSTGDNTSSHTAIWMLPTLGGSVSDPGGNEAVCKRIYSTAWEAVHGAGTSLAVTNLKTNRKFRSGVCLHAGGAGDVPKWLNDRIGDLPDSLNRLRFFDAGFFAPRMLTDGAPGGLVLLGDPVE